MQVFEINVLLRTKKVLPYIAQMKDMTDRAQWVKVIMKKTFINEEALWEDLKKVGVVETAYNPKVNSSPPGSRADTIERKILGIIGYGHIGSQVSVLAENMGMKVMFYDIEPKLSLGNAVPVKTLKDLLEQADIHDVKVMITDKGDHYDPTKKRLCVK